MNLDNLSRYEGEDIFEYISRLEAQGHSVHNWHFTLQVTKSAVKYLTEDLGTLCEALAADVAVHVVSRECFSTTVVIDMYGVSVYQAKQIYETARKYESL